MECPCLREPVTTNQVYGFQLERPSGTCSEGTRRNSTCCPTKARCAGKCNAITVGSSCTSNRSPSCCGRRRGSHPKPFNVGFSGSRETVDERINRIVVCQQCQQSHQCQSGSGCATCCCRCCSRDVQLWHVLNGAVVHIKL